jgi:hypothetical protein
MGWEWVPPTGMAWVAVVGTATSAWIARLNVNAQHDLALDQAAEKRRAERRDERKRAYDRLLEAGYRLGPALWIM